MTPQQEVTAALRLLESKGHCIGEVHIPPPNIGRNIRVWIDGVSRSFEDVLRMAKAEAAS